MAEGHALSPRTDALDVIVELLDTMDGAHGPSGREFYDRLIARHHQLTSAAPV